MIEFPFEQRQNGKQENPIVARNFPELRHFQEISWEEKRWGANIGGKWRRSQD